MRPRAKEVQISGRNNLKDGFCRYHGRVDGKYTEVDIPQERLEKMNDRDAEKEIKRSLSQIANWEKEEGKRD